MTATQWAFDLTPEDERSRDIDIEGASSRAARQALAQWRDWPSGAIVLVGPPGSGKTHLAAHWARAVGAGVFLDDAPGAFVWDDADRSLHEARLFAAVEASVHGVARPALLTARREPAVWPLSLPDLRSRLRLLPVIALTPPTRTELEACVAAHLSARGVDAPADAIKYVVRTIGLSFADALAAVARLDRGALARGGRITRRVAEEVLHDQFHTEGSNAQAEERDGGDAGQGPRSSPTPNPAQGEGEGERRDDD